MRAILAFAVILISVWILEAACSDITISQSNIGQTPVTLYAKPGADGPTVVVAHGFAGSQQMMQGYARPLARAGYRVFAFEFMGHGRHPVPMSGDVNLVDGTTRLLVEQASDVIGALAKDNEPYALRGHSMATDILVRVAASRKDVGPVVLISALSQIVDRTTPENLPLVTGAWEPGLRAFAVDALRMVDADAFEGEAVSDGAIVRRAIAAPFTEHVSILQSRVGRGEAVPGWTALTGARLTSRSCRPGLQL